MESRCRHLFVYNPLRKEFHESTHHYITQYFSFISAVQVKGVVIDIGGEYFATPGDGSFFINGELYLLNDEHNFSYVFGQIDDYEGLITEPGERKLYRREITKVYKDENEITDAWIYWYNGNTDGKPVITSQDFLSYVNPKNRL